MKTSNADGKIPPGALAYLRFKVYTINYAMLDIELHQLHGEMHLGSRDLTKPKDCHRGVWMRKPATKKTEAETMFYPEGYAVLDWHSGAQGNS
jgi:hypothetical protein